MKKLLLILLFFFTNHLSAQSVWQGTIGNIPIVMQLECSVEELQENPKKCYGGTYFYKSSLQSMTLNGEYNERAKRLYLAVGLSDKIYETFKLKYHKKRVIGTWSNKNKNLKVKLSLLPLVQSLDEVRSKLLKFKRLKVEKIAHKKELVWIKEEFSANKFFRLGNGFTKQNQAKINPLLDELQKEYANGDLSCFNTWAYGSGMDSSSDLELSYVSDKLLGFKISVGYDCGGVHPDFFTARYIVNINSAKVYKLKDILTIAKNPKKIRALAFEQAKMKLEPSKDNDNYDPYNLSHWEYLTWDLYKNGIRFYLDFSPASRCYRGDYYEISFERLKPYLSKEFLSLVKGKNIYVKEVES